MSTKPLRTEEPSALTPHDPHDRFFAFTFGRKEHAVGLLRAALPQALAARLDWDTLKRQPADFVDRNLRWRYSDLLFAVRVQGGREQILVYVLVEHQRKPHPLMPLRVQGYLVRIWEEYLKAHPGETRLQMILPLVV